MPGEQEPEDVLRSWQAWVGAHSKNFSLASGDPELPWLLHVCKLFRVGYWSPPELDALDSLSNTSETDLEKESIFCYAKDYP